MSYLSLLAEIMSSNSFIKIVVVIVNIIVHLHYIMQFCLQLVILFVMIGIVLDLFIESTKIIIARDRLKC